MNNFKDFGISAVTSKFIGDKISVSRLVNTEITVVDFKLADSVKKPGTQCLTLQIEKGGEKRVVFTGSRGLISQICQVPRESFPFKTTITIRNEYYEFT